MAKVKAVSESASSPVSKMRMPQFDEIRTIDPNAGFSVGEAARLLGVSHNGILGRIATGSIMAGRSGHRYYILGSEIQKQITLPGEMVTKKATVAAPETVEAAPEIPAAKAADNL
jgi:hypothetical protein